MTGTHIPVFSLHKQQQNQSYDDEREVTKKRRRWVTKLDILNATTTTTNSDLDGLNLKYAYDVNNSVTNGLQGLAIDPITQNVLYEVHTMSLRVLELGSNGSNNDNGDDEVDNTIIVKSVKQTKIFTSDDFPTLYNNETVRHIGGVDLANSSKYRKELWMAVHSDGINGMGALVAVDTHSLMPKLSRYVLWESNLDWVAYDSSNDDGILYFGEFFNVNQIHRVKLDTLDVLSDLIIDTSNVTFLRAGGDGGGMDYIQSGTFDPNTGNLILLGDDYQSTIYEIDVDTGRIVNYQPLLLGSETDGITFWQDNHLLVGVNRFHSHEQVMGDSPMVSIIELELEEELR